MDAEAGGGAAGAVALTDAQGRRYVTALPAGATATPGYLDSLLAAAGPDRIVVGYPSDRGRLATLLRGGRGLTAAKLRVALDSSAGLLLPAEHAAGGAREAIVRAGLDVVLAAPVALYTAPPAASAADPIEVLAGLAEATTPAQRLLVEAQLLALNERLRAHPDEHPAVLAALRERGLGWLDYRRLNAGLGRDLAILYAALPFSDTAANVAARRVRAAGRVVDVVAADLSAHRGVDESAEAIWREYLDERWTVPTAATVEGDWREIASFCRLGLAMIESAERRKGSYRSVYSRTMFPAAHLLAARYKLRHPETPWCAEYSDPQLRDSRGGPRRGRGAPDEPLLAELRAGLRGAGLTPPAGDNVWEWAEAVGYALADTVLFTNEAQRDYMLGYCADRQLAERGRAHAAVLRHPTPPAELYRLRRAPYELDPQRVHLGYFGVFYATRGLTEVTEALRGLPAAERDRLRLHVFTRDPDALTREVAGLGLDDVLVAHPYLQFLDYLELSTRLDALLVNDYRAAELHGVNPYLPAKYADYRGSGRPIWGIVEPGSVLDGSHLDYRSELGDVAGARAVLAALARAPRP